MAEQVSSLMTGIKYKNTPIGKIPVDWEVVSLKDVSEINMGQSPLSEDCNDKGTGLPFYQGNAEFGSKYPIPQKWCDSPKKVANEGDILISVRAPVGEINIAPHKCGIGRGLAAVNSNAVHDEFLYHSLFLHMKALQKIAQGSTFEAINRKELSELLIFFPPAPEQKKIAKILTTVGEAIEKTAWIIEKTKEAKNGLMQKLLTRGIGHKKFKETEIGEIPEEWEVKKLIDIANNEKYSFTGGPFGSDLKEDSYPDRGIRIIQLQNIGDGKFLDEYKIFTSEEKANQLKNCNIYPGDVMIAKMADPVARACIIPDTEKRYLMASDGIRLSVNKNEYDVKFVLYAINSPRFRKNAEKHGTGTTRLRIGLTELKNLPIGIPPLEEQKQIAEILSSADEGIEKEMNHREQLEALKKGLMQALLTGKIRVSV